LHPPQTLITFTLAATFTFALAFVFAVAVVCSPAPSPNTVILSKGTHSTIASAAVKGPAAIVAVALLVIQRKAESPAATMPVASPPKTCQAPKLKNPRKPNKTEAIPTRAIWAIAQLISL
jgi:hypothetical protein